ncbi:primase 1D-like protein [Cupriavidus cauae]|uniref:Uncharacterized protein n=1 Tax=Cupriavidus cauae TaxID=2608999 RepID=A0A5M8B1H8_9BURK|nr:hypothetical protein [Cupriavidus cauae]KAA6129667.1 hypothetical protein F1599_05225 [Cupriavidus cauae]
MNFDAHPLLVLKQLRQHYGDAVSCTFSVYEYQPQSIDDKRQSFSVKISEVTYAWLESVLAGLPPKVELALHSNVILEGKTLHIPMVDFATRSRAQLPKLKEFLGQKIVDSILWFDSGRSFHGYAATLITEIEWIELMGRLLLANKPNQTPLTDPRWVGHRLIAGYSALRWSCNTRQYIQIPQLVTVP